MANSGVLYPSLQTTGETHQIRADAEGSALTGRHAHRGRHHIQDSKHHGGEDGQGGDLIEAQRLARDEQGRRSDDQALNQILNHAVDDFCNAVVHFYTQGFEKNPRLGEKGEVK
jgi:hypothetical protein